MESGTTELVLPGLDSIPAKSVTRGAGPGTLARARVAEATDAVLGRSHPDLAQRIGEQLGVELGEVELKTFANDETYCRYGESVRGADLFLVQTGCRPGRPEPDGAADDDPGGEARLGEARSPP